MSVQSNAEVDTKNPTKVNEMAIFARLLYLLDRALIGSAPSAQLTFDLSSLNDLIVYVLDFSVDLQGRSHLSF